MGVITYPSWVDQTVDWLVKLDVLPLLWHCFCFGLACSPHPTVHVCLPSMMKWVFYPTLCNCFSWLLEHHWLLILISVRFNDSDILHGHKMLRLFITVPLIMETLRSGHFLWEYLWCSHLNCHLVMVEQLCNTLFDIRLQLRCFPIKWNVKRNFKKYCHVIIRYIFYM